MSTRDNASMKKVVQHLAAALYTATQTPTNGVDLKGFESVSFLIDVGAVANIANSPQPSWTFKAEESDTINSGFAAITDSNRILIAGAKSPVAAPDGTTGVFLTVDASGETGKTYHVGVISSKRYVRIVSTAANTPGNSGLSIVAILEHGSILPVLN